MYPLSDDEKRIVAWLRWQAANESNIDSQIALERMADEIEAGKHRGD